MYAIVDSFGDILVVYSEPTEAQKHIARGQAYAANVGIEYHQTVSVLTVYQTVDDAGF